MKSEVIDRLAALVTAAFGLVAALAWNDAIKALFKGPCGSKGAGALCALLSGGPWVYAISVTPLAIIVTLGSLNLLRNLIDVSLMFTRFIFACVNLCF